MKVIKLILAITTFFCSFFPQFLKADVFSSRFITSNDVIGEPKGIALAQLNEDTILDGLVVLSSTSNVNQLQFTNNSFSLLPGASSSVDNMGMPSSPLDIALGDFDGDGDLDFMVTKDLGPSASYYLNTGISMGRIVFDSGTNFIPSDNMPQRIITTELESGDHRSDVIILDWASPLVPHTSRVVITPNHGMATFAFPGVQRYFNDSTSHSLIAGHFNSDMNIDIVVTNGASNNVSILLGNGDGTFRPSMGDFPTYPAGNTLNDPWGIQAADVDGDGDNDLVVANHGNNTLSVLLNDGMGAFSLASSPAPTCQQPTNLVLGDFNHDSRRDAAVICVGDGKLRILVGDGAGHFSTTALQPDITLGDNPYDILTGDFNRDGKDDLLVSVTGANRLVTLLGNTPPSFRDGSFDAATGTFSVTYVDADGDLPSSMKIRIGETGEFVDMQEVSATERDVTSGKRYQYRPTSLNAGTYAYFFQTSDGLHSLTFRNESSASLAQDIVPARSGGCSLNAKASSVSLVFTIGLLGLGMLGWRRKI